MGFSPKVSIVIPVYNGANFLEQAIDSALAQTYQNTEVLVVNDGSSDGGATEYIALAYGEKIRYFSQANGGVASALNRAIKEMTGDYFSWLSHDDLYCATKVERQVAKIVELADDRTIIYSDYSVFSNDPERALAVRLKGVSPHQFRYWITVENALHGCTLLVPKRAFLDCGSFRENLRTTQDYDLWFRLAEKYRFVHLSEVLVMARSHAEQGSIKMARTALKECNVLLSGFVRSLTTDELVEATHCDCSVAYATIADSMWRRGFGRAGWSAARLALKSLPRVAVRDRGRAIRILMEGALRNRLAGWTRLFLSPKFRIRMTGARNRLGLFADRLTSRRASLEQRFSEIYDKNLFGGRASRSGEGSDLIQTAVIRNELPKLIQEFGVTSFLDAPCGDWFWMQHADLGVQQYIGVDIVEALIAKNQREFGASGISFECLNIAADRLPAVDLIFSRDCLVHLSFEDALRVIENFKRSGSKYLLTTTFNLRDRNSELAGRDSFWRPLNMQLPPFSFPAPILLLNENCTEDDGRYADKSLGLWRIADIKC